MVISRFSLPYWSDPQRSFNEFFRVLKKDGLIFLDVLNKDFPKFRLWLIKLHMYLRGAGGAVVRYHLDSYKMAYSYNEVVLFLKNAGFSNISPGDAGVEWHYMLSASK